MSGDMAGVLVAVEEKACAMYEADYAPLGKWQYADQREQDCYRVLAMDSLPGDIGKGDSA